MDPRFNAANFYTGYGTNQPVASNRLGWYSDYWDTNIYRSGGGDTTGWGVSLNGTVATNPFLFVARTGNVGIGTTAPAQLLDITTSALNPAIRMQNTYAAAYLSMGAAVGVNTYIGLQTTNATTGALGTPPLVVTNYGTVGIGTTTPGSTLDILGTFKVRGEAHPTAGFVQSLNIANVNGGSPYSSWSAINAVYEGSMGNILKLNPGNYATFLGGLVYLENYTTNGTVTTINSVGQISISSDRRIKENIVYQSDTQQGLASVLNLKPATYHLIGQVDTHLGFIAQDLEQDIPLAVDGKKYEWQWETTEDGKPKFDANGDIVYKVDADGNRIVRPRGVSDRAIIATQTLAIQELAKQATSHAALVQELSKKLDAKSAALDSLIAWAQTQGYSPSV